MQYYVYRSFRALTHFQQSSKQGHSLLRDNDIMVAQDKEACSRLSSAQWKLGPLLYYNDICSWPSAASQIIGYRIPAAAAALLSRIKQPRCDDVSSILSPLYISPLYMNILLLLLTMCYLITSVSLSCRYQHQHHRSGLVDKICQPFPHEGSEPKPPTSGDFFFRDLRLWMRMRSKVQLEVKTSDRRRREWWPSQSQQEYYGISWRDIVGSEAEKDAHMDFGEFGRRVRSKFRYWCQRLNMLWKRGTNLIKNLFNAPTGEEIMLPGECEIRTDMEFEDYIHFLNQKYQCTF